MHIQLDAKNDTDLKLTSSIKLERQSTMIMLVQLMRG